MSHSEAIAKAAQAVFEEYQRVDREHVGLMTWDELAQESKATWAHLARVAITTYTDWK